MAEIKMTTIAEIKNNPMGLVSLLVQIFDGFDEPMIGALIGTSVDITMANKGKTSEETLGLYKAIYETAKSAHAVLGMPEKVVL